MEYDIEVKNLSRIYKKNIPGKGFRRIFPKKMKIRAVDDISFNIKKGEFVAYVGANGSGKTTTIKMLTGILIPTKGVVKCLGMIPWKQRIKYTKDIGVVFGQKTMLKWDLPAIDSLLLYKDIYEVSDSDFKERMQLYDKILNINERLNQQVRKMSFGERMRCELAASLLHRPKILFLDEPTVGMDVVAKEEIRNFLRNINEKEKTTIILTTHDMGDVEALCDRIILLDKGKIIYDGRLDKLKKKYIQTKNISITYGKVKNKKFVERSRKKVKILEEEKGYVKLSVNIKEHDIKKVISDIIKSVDVIDISVEEPELSEIVAKIYREGRVK